MLRVIPLSLSQANKLILQWHRHHKNVQGHRFSLGLLEDGALHGACVVGRPVSRGCDPYLTAEVTRLVTDGVKNGCSFLYSAAARAAREMGFAKIQTYILESESGVSLKAAGWQYAATTAGGDWNNSKKYAGKRRVDQPQCAKQRWEKALNANNNVRVFP